MKPILRMACMVLSLSLPLMAATTAELDEFKIKRQEVFEFSSKPALVREGHDLKVSFASKGYCDATVAIEDMKGHILRHLVSGVLGPKAPEPFQPNSLKQMVPWDGKNDQGEYIDERDDLVVRVSLGLKPVFERTLFWSPKKRIGPGNRPLFASAPEGVYVFEGGGVDHLRLFDHAGNYVRTVYPFPPDYTSPEAKSDGPEGLKAALTNVKGLNWLQAPQDGKWFPQWQGLLNGTMLTSGSSFGRNGATKYGAAASAMALRPGKPGHLALVMHSINRIATDGTTGGLPLEGPKTTVEVSNPGGYPNPLQVAPLSTAFSADGKYLYTTGYTYGLGQYQSATEWMPCVLRVPFDGEKDAKYEIFKGSVDPKKAGADNDSFNCPIWLTCDASGRLYVADYGNDRVQVFMPDGKFYKSIPIKKPVRVFVNPKNGDVHVASWTLISRHDVKLPAVYTHMGPVDDPKVIATCPLPLASYCEGLFMNRTSMTHDMFVDFQTDPPMVWLVPGSGDTTEKLMQQRRDYSKGQWQFSGWSACHLRLLTEQSGKLVEKANFAKDVGEAITRITPPAAPSCERQRLYVNPKTGKLYVLEGDSGVGKAVKELLQIDPETGKVSTQPMPFTTEEITFDLDGQIYLRTDIAVGRYELETWREVPWDYGEELDHPGFDGDGTGTQSVLLLPGTGKPGCFHLGGFNVSPKGEIIVSCYNQKPLEKLADVNKLFPTGKPYQPPLYPGRLRWAEVHVWDKFGKPAIQDAVPGLPMTDGLAIDKDGSIYALVAGRRVLGDGKSFPLECAETLMKFKPRKTKFLSTANTCPIPLSGDSKPTRAADVTEGFSGSAWVEGAEWMYGGVGVDGFIPNRGDVCSCWNARFALDLYARSFATELGRSSVAILDTNGNLILRVGKYGNVDDGVPIVKEGGPANPRSIGGDEVALARPAYVATHSDRRLFIADYGNYRILSVKLEYHADETVKLSR